MNHQILLPSLVRNSQEPKLRRIFEILWVLFEKISVFCSEWPKSWICWTLGQVKDIFCKCHLYYASKEVFWPKTFWIPCMGSKVPFWQFFNSGKMALLNSCIKFKSFCWKTSFKALWRWLLSRGFTFLMGRLVFKTSVVMKTLQYTKQHIPFSSNPSSQSFSPSRIHDSGMHLPSQPRLQWPPEHTLSPYWQQCRGLSHITLDK